MSHASKQTRHEAIIDKITNLIVTTNLDYNHNSFENNSPYTIDWDDAQKQAKKIYALIKAESVP